MNIRWQNEESVCSVELLVDLTGPEIQAAEPLFIAIRGLFQRAFLRQGKWAKIYRAELLQYEGKSTILVYCRLYDERVKRRILKRFVRQLVSQAEQACAQPRKKGKK